MEGTEPEETDAIMRGAMERRLEARRALERLSAEEDSMTE